MYREYFQLLQKTFHNLFLGRKKPFVYVALGDSTVAGYGATKPERGYAGIVYHALKERYPKAIFYNLGRSNATVAEVLQKQVPKAVDLNPDLVTISIGANDIRFHTQVKQFEKQLKAVLDVLKQQTHAPIVINNIPDFSLLPAVPKHLRTVSKILLWQLNKKIKYLAESYNIIFVDLCKQGRVFSKHFPEVVFEDGFHPSDFGYALWANTVLASIQHMLTKPTFWNI